MRHSVGDMPRHVRDFEEWIRDVAVRLDADLRSVGEELSATVVVEPGILHSAAVGLPVAPAPLPLAIAVRHRGVENLRLVFFPEETRPLGEQVEERLEEVQVLVAETTAEQWPRCPEHGHELAPYGREGAIGWLCPDSHRIVAPLGCIADLEGG